MKRMLKKFYTLLPFKRELYHFLRIFWRPGEKLYRHMYFKGVFSVRVDKSHSFRMMHYGYQVENEIFWEGLEGGWERVSFSLWIKLCRRSDVIFDIGSNTGIYALIAKSLAPGASVYAFEPVKRVFEKLRVNTDLNKYNINCVEAAASNFNGKATIFDTDTEHVYSVTVNKNLYSPGTKTIPSEIATMRMDTFIAAKGLDKIDLMKIDVETHEPEVLEGLGEYLSRFRPALLIEILDDETGKRVEATVSGLGYLYFNIDERSGVRRLDRIKKSDYFNYLLCSPEIASELGLSN